MISVNSYLSSLIVGRTERRFADMITISYIANMLKLRFERNQIRTSISLCCQSGMMFLISVIFYPIDSCRWIRIKKLVAPPSNSLHPGSRPGRLSQEIGQIRRTGPKNYAEIIGMESKCSNITPLTEKGEESMSQPSRRGVCKSSLMAGLGGEPTKN
jgi:hypothetical protein